jgi:hypothetical protein
VVGCPDTGGDGWPDTGNRVDCGSGDAGADHSVGIVGAAQGVGAGSACQSELVDQSVDGQAGGCSPVGSGVRSLSLLDVMGSLFRRRWWFCLRSEHHPDLRTA